MSIERPHRNLSVLLAYILMAGFSVANAQEAQQGKTTVIRRPKCSIVSPQYTGPCRHIVVTTGRDGEFNLRFGISDSGDTGITFSLSDVVSQDANGSAVFSTVYVLSRFPSKELVMAVLPGTCSLTKVRMQCSTINGVYRADAIGVER